MSAQTAESRKMRAIQTLEEAAKKFCTERLNALFIYDIQAKASTNPMNATYAHLCKNDILFVLERVMSFEGPNILTSHAGLEGPLQSSLFTTPSERFHGPSVTTDAKDFMKEYENRMETIRATYDAEKAQEESAQEQVPPGGRITNFFPRAPRGGSRSAKRRSSRKRL